MLQYIRLFATAYSESLNIWSVQKDPKKETAESVHSMKIGLSMACLGFYFDQALALKIWFAKGRCYISGSFASPDLGRGKDFCCCWCTQMLASIRLLQHFCSTCKMYVSKVQNVFVQIVKCIFPKCKMYLSIL